MNKRKEFLAELSEAAGSDSPIFYDVLHALGTDPTVDAYFIRPETVMDDESVYNSIAAYVVSSGRLIIIVSDISYEFSTEGEFMTTTLFTELSAIRDYQLLRRRILTGDDRGSFTGVMMRLRWGAGMSIDLPPAACDDPNCEAEHGYWGRLTGEDAEIVLDGTLSEDVFLKGLAFIEDLAAMIREASRG